MRNALITILVMINFNAFTQDNSIQAVKIVNNEADEKVDIYIAGKLFTSYCFSSPYEKPFFILSLLQTARLLHVGFQSTQDRAKGLTILTRLESGLIMEM